MQTLIKKGSVAQDSWTLLREGSGPEILEIIEGKDLIVPMKFWNLYKTDIEHYSGNITVWLDSHEFIDEIKDHLHSFPLIALNFPVFADGRPYTAARELRQNLNFLFNCRMPSTWALQTVPQCFIIKPDIMGVVCGVSLELIVHNIPIVNQVAFLHWLHLSHHVHHPKGWWGVSIRRR